MRGFRDESGSVTVEMGFFGIVMFFSLIAGIDYASVINARMQLGSAVRAGAKFAMANPADTSNIPNVVRGASTLPSGSVNVTASQFCECVSGTTVTCGTTCAGGASAARYTAINASYPAPIMIGYPGIPNPYNIAQAATVRVQ